MISLCYIGEWTVVGSLIHVTSEDMYLHDHHGRQVIMCEKRVRVVCVGVFGVFLMYEC